MPRKSRDGGLFGADPLGYAGPPLGRAVDPAEAVVLRLLRAGALTPAELKKHVPDPAAAVAALRDRGRDIRSVLWYGQTCWRYALVEKGVMYGPGGKEVRS